MKNEILIVDGTRWMVREAVSREAAIKCINVARARGSVGAKDSVDSTACGGGVTVIADVVQINSDGTRRMPYAAPY